MSKVFGIGLSRTGTKSLAAALNLLGIKTCWYPHDYQTYYDIVRGQYRLRVLEQYDAITDTPAVPFFAQFDEVFPGSKFILTVRDKASWLESCKKHWSYYPDGPVALPDTSSYVEQFGHFIDLIVYGSYLFNHRRWSYVFDHHIETVQQYFRERPDDLLTIDFTKGDGWDRLCPFLGLTPPSQPFPMINDFGHELLG